MIIGTVSQTARGALHLCVVLVLLFVPGGCRSESVARTITPSATLGPSPTVGLDPIAQPTAMVGPSPTPSPPPTSTVTPTPTPPPAPAFVASHPIAGDQAVPPTGPLLLVFDQPMDCAAVASALVISPTVEGRFDCPHPEQVLFAPTAWADNTAYTVVLGTGARSAAGQVLTAPVKISFATGGAGAPIPIIMYHALLELDDDATPTQLEWTTSPQNFAAQMEYLAQAGYTTVDFEDLLAYLEQAQPLPPKPVLITFDDGHYTFRTQAWPALKALDFRVTLFVVADYAAYQGYLSWEQIAELAGEGVTIGSHSLNHAALTKVDADEVLRQVGDSKSQIEKHAGETVHLFSYPYGAYDDAVIAALIQTGYRAACTINPSFYQHRGDNYSLNRIHPTYNDTLDDFIARLP